MSYWRLSSNGLTGAGKNVPPEFPFSFPRSRKFLIQYAYLRIVTAAGGSVRTVDLRLYDTTQTVTAGLHLLFDSTHAAGGTTTVYTGGPVPAQGGDGTVNSHVQWNTQPLICGGQFAVTGGVTANYANADSWEYLICGLEGDDAEPLT